MIKVPIPANSAELTEFLGDPSRWPAELNTKVGMSAFLAEYSQALVNSDPAIGTQIKEQMTSVLAEFLKDNKEGDAASRFGPGVPVDLTPNQILAGVQAPRAGLYNKRAIGAKLDSEAWAHDPIQYFQAIWHKSRRDEATVVDIRNKLHQALRNSMSERVPADGGFLVPEVLRSDLLRVVLETAVVRPRARIIPMETLRVPYPGVDDTSHTANVYGGVAGYWTEEGASLTASQPSFNRVVLEAKKLTAYTEVPNELFMDAIAAFSQFFGEVFPEAISFFEDDAFINGSGQGEPQGYLNSPCTISVSRGTSSHVTFPDIANMFPKMLPQSYNRAIWVCSPGVIADLLQLALVNPPGATAGTAVAPPLWLSSVGGQASAVGAPTWNLLGRPLYVTEKHPALGSTGDLAFFDPGYYLLGDRQAMQAETSEHYKFANDMTAVRIIERLDGRTWVQSAITAKNGTDTISPVVVLHS